MQIDCLCVTTSRRKRFKNWLLWNYEKQNYNNKNLIVVSDDTDWPHWVQLIQSDISDSIPKKRNMALAAATGTAITWFDDDDWQSSNKLSTIANCANQDTMVGCTESFFYDIFSGLIKTYSRKIIFNSIGIFKDGLPAFDEQHLIASDTHWLKMLTHFNQCVVDELLFFWISHNDNISNPAKKIKAMSSNYDLDGETWHQLMKLRTNLHKD